MYMYLYLHLYNTQRNHNMYNSVLYVRTHLKVYINTKADGRRQRQTAADGGGGRRTAVADGGRRRTVADVLGWNSPAVAPMFSRRRIGHMATAEIPEIQGQFYNKTSENPSAAKALFGKKRFYIYQYIYYIYIYILYICTLILYVCGRDV
jgi:hypothetical protein